MRRDVQQSRDLSESDTLAFNKVGSGAEGGGRGDGES
jgi:hypothetical protein